MRRSLAFGFQPYLKWLIIFGSLLMALVIGAGIAGFALQVRELFILLLGAVFALAILIPRESILRIGLGIGIITFVFGWRTLALTPDFILAPFEVLIWCLAFILVVRAIVHKERVMVTLPYPLILLGAACALGTLVGATNQVDWVKSVAYAKNVLLLVPCFFVIQSLVPNFETWRRIMYVAIAVGVYLSMVGLLLIYFPIVGKPIAVLLSANLLQSGEFTRLGFPGWGPLAAWFMILLLAIVLGFWDMSRNRAEEIVFAVFFGILGVAILGSGQRGAWIAAIVGFVIYAFLNPRRFAFLAAVLGGMILSLPEGSFTERLVSALDPRYFDSSATGRYDRAGNALSQLLANPISGLGFGALTYVHNDYLEIGVALGLGGLALFVAALVETGWHLVRTWRNTRQRERGLMARALLVMFVMLVVELNGAGFVTLSFLASTLWFFWAMAHQFTRLEDVAA
jgi:O-antigen ligase